MSTALRTIIRQREHKIETLEGEIKRLSKQWQLISTAPKDGTFLVWLSEPHKTMDTNVGVMMRHPNVTFINGLFAFDLPEPTHWMPLPAPPAS